MTLSGRTDRDAAIAALLAVARRETLALAVASGALDDDAAAVASARLRWAIEAARHLVAGGAHAPALDRHRHQLDRVANRAQRWLVSEPPRSLHAIGRLVDRLAARRGRAPRALDAGYAHLGDLDLDDLDLGRISLVGATLIEITARRARWDALDARDSRWRGCALDDGALIGAVLAGGTLEACELARARLDGTSWHRAAASRTWLGAATLTDARLERARFVDCSLRGAALGIARSPELASLAGAEFVRCDLRDTCWAGRDLGGAAFIDCALSGAHGAPATRGAVIEGADLSPHGEGSRRATADEVIAAWRTPGDARPTSPNIAARAARRR